MTAKTFNLTQTEIAEIISKKPTDDEQKMLLRNLRRLSGIRYGVTVGGGTFQIVKCAFAIGANDKTNGSADVAVVRGNLKQHNIVPALRKMIAAL